MLTTGRVNSTPWILLISWRSSLTACRISGTSGSLVIGFGSRPTGTTFGVTVAAWSVDDFVVGFELIRFCSLLETGPLTFGARVVGGLFRSTFDWSAEVRLPAVVRSCDMAESACWVSAVFTG